MYVEFHLRGSYKNGKDKYYGCLFANNTKLREVGPPKPLSAYDAHWDLYKVRAAVKGFEGTLYNLKKVYTRCARRHICGLNKVRAKATLAVSYTHLDVYKRQKAI